MKCIGKFKNDRICELCQIANKVEHDECLEIRNKKIELNKRLNKIRHKCPYIEEEYSYSDREEYYICKNELVENKYCIVSLECEKYIK